MIVMRHWLYVNKLFNHCRIAIHRHICRRAVVAMRYCLTSDKRMIDMEVSSALYGRETRQWLVVGGVTWNDAECRVGSLWPEHQTNPKLFLSVVSCMCRSVECCQIWWCPWRSWNTTDINTLFYFHLPVPMSLHYLLPCFLWLPLYFLLFRSYSSHCSLWCLCLCRLIGRYARLYGCWFRTTSVQRCFDERSSDRWRRPIGEVDW